MVSYLATWNDNVEGKPYAGPINYLPVVDFDKDTSTPDTHSICFSVALSLNCCFMFVNWREVWSNGAIYWHTSLLDQYSFELGLDESTKRLQQHISYIIDWGLCERAPLIYGQARELAERMVGAEEDMPLPPRKRQRTEATDDSD